MTAIANKFRSPWTDRFETPTVETLIEAINSRAAAQLFEHARNRLQSIPDVREELSWMGLPWRWALSYWQSPNSERAIAYLIADPNLPRLAVPLASDMLPQLSMKRLSKAIRDAIIFAPTVDGIRWCQWDISAKPQIEDAIGLLHATPPSPSARS